MRRRLTDEADFLKPARQRDESMMLRRRDSICDQLLKQPWQRSSHDGQNRSKRIYTTCHQKLWSSF